MEILLDSRRRKRRFRYSRRNLVAKVGRIGAAAPKIDAGARSMGFHARQAFCFGFVMKIEGI
jgi:hypothetical protein